MADIIAFLTVHGLDVLLSITSIVTGASFFANFTKTDIDNKILAFLSKALNIIALNFKK